MSLDFIKCGLWLSSLIDGVYVAYVGNKVCGMGHFGPIVMFLLGSYVECVVWDAPIVIMIAMMMIK